MRTLEQLIESISYYMDNKLVLEMGNMQPRDTGLKPIVHIMHKGGAKHGPRVKVSNIAGTFHHSNNFSVTVENEPRVVCGTSSLRKDHLEMVLDWVKLNKDHLHKVWHDDTLSPTEVDKGFKRL